MSHVVIFEDEIDLVEVYRFALESAQHQVLDTFLSAAQFQRKPSSAVEARPVSVILDERLGNESGTALIPAIRSSYARARIILATADPDTFSRASELGVDGALKKPFRMAELISSVS